MSLQPSNHCSADYYSLGDNALFLPIKTHAEDYFVPINLDMAAWVLSQYVFHIQQQQ